MWLQPDHPDPRRTTLQLLGRALRVLVESMGGTFAVYLDCCSLFQGARLASEEKLFQLARARQCDLFAHPHTWVLMVTTRPKGFPRGLVFKPGTKPNVAEYDGRGWTFAEARISSLAKVNNSMVLDLGLLDQALENYAAKVGDGDVLEDDEHARAVGERCGCDFDTLVTTAQAAKPPPLTPAQFADAVGTKRFSYRNADLGLVRQMYKRSFTRRMKAAETLDFSRIGWTDADAMQLASVLAGGWARSCKRLNLAYNAIGDEGMAAVAACLESEKAPREVEQIDLRGNPASGAARQAVADAAKKVNLLNAQQLSASGATDGEVRERAGREVRVLGTPQEEAMVIQRRFQRRKAERLKMAGRAAMLQVRLARSVRVSRNSPPQSPQPIRRSSFSGGSRSSVLDALVAEQGSPMKAG